VLSVVVAVAAAGAAASSPEQALLSQINAVRAANGLSPLRDDPSLDRAARFHTHTMLATGVLAHGSFGARMTQFHVRGSLAGENLAWATGSRATARATVAAWLRSPEHRANLLRPMFRRVGVGELVGTFLGHSGARVVTADFAG
jgi:uncharacterized protein YkwD